MGATYKEPRHLHPFWDEVQALSFEHVRCPLLTRAAALGPVVFRRNGRPAPAGRDAAGALWMLLRSLSKCRPTFALPVVPIARYTRLARYTRSVARRGIVREPERQRSARRSHLWTTIPHPTAYGRPPPPFSRVHLSRTCSARASSVLSWARMYITGPRVPRGEVYQQQQP